MVIKEARVYRVGNHRPLGCLNSQSTYASLNRSKISEPSEKGLNGSISDLENRKDGGEGCK